MDYKEMMERYAPKDCQPTEVTPKSRLEAWAKRLGKKVEDLTEAEKKAEAENYDAACNSPSDWMGS